MTSGFDVRYVGRQRCGDEIATVRFERPAGYSFEAGQWFTLALETSEGPMRQTFSHSNAPSDDWLELTTRLTGSSFKRALEALSPGDIAHITGPGGRLALPSGAERVAFLVGGVGITPVRSVLRDARSCGRVFDDALLVFGNRDASCIPFAAEFESMSDMGVRVVDVLEQPSGTWEGERGFITADLVKRHLPHGTAPLFFVTGPPVMVAAMERVLDELGVPAQQRLIERFGAVHPGAG